MVTGSDARKVSLSLFFIYLPFFSYSIFPSLYSSCNDDDDLTLTAPRDSSFHVADTLSPLYIFSLSFFLSHFSTLPSFSSPSRSTSSSFREALRPLFVFLNFSLFLPFFFVPPPPSSSFLTAAAAVAATLFFMTLSTKRTTNRDDKSSTEILSRRVEPPSFGRSNGVFATYTNVVLSSFGVLQDATTVI